MSPSCKNPHFILKLIAFILLLLTILVTIRPTRSCGYGIAVEALLNTSAVVVLVLIIAILFFDSPKVTEICMIIAVIVMLIIACCLLGSQRTEAYVASEKNGYYVVFTDEDTRRKTFLGLTIPAIIVEIIDLILLALDK